MRTHIASSMRTHISLAHSYHQGDPFTGSMRTHIVVCSSTRTHISRVLGGCYDMLSVTVPVPRYRSTKACRIIALSAAVLCMLTDADGCSNCWIERASISCGCCDDVKASHRGIPPRSFLRMCRGRPVDPFIRINKVFA